MHAEIHFGMDGHHAAAQALVNKAFQKGFYWLRIRANAKTLVDKCIGCEVFANQSHMPPRDLRTNPITWPFVVWGLDMIRKLKGSQEKEVSTRHGRQTFKVDKG